MSNDDYNKYDQPHFGDGKTKNRRCNERIGCEPETPLEEKLRSGSPGKISAIKSVKMENPLQYLAQSHLK
jgi:hypothetical protein